MISMHTLTRAVHVMVKPTTSRDDTEAGDFRGRSIP